MIIKLIITLHLHLLHFWKIKAFLIILESISDEDNIAGWGDVLLRQNKTNYHRFDFCSLAIINLLKLLKVKSGWCCWPTVNSISKQPLMKEYNINKRWNQPSGKWCMSLKKRKLRIFPKLWWFFNLTVPSMREIPWQTSFATIHVAEYQWMQSFVILTTVHKNF